MKGLTTLTLEVGTTNRTSDMTIALDLMYEKSTVIIKVQVTDGTKVMVQAVDLVFAKEHLRVKDGEAGFVSAFEFLGCWVRGHG